VTEEISSFEWIYHKVMFILGGLLIPLDFYPAWLRSIALSMPFAYTVYGPARLFVDPELTRFAMLLLAQTAWLTALGGLLAFAYRKGVIWLSINGG
jgi:ABC-2 type transport system permease protein